MSTIGKIFVVVNLVLALVVVGAAGTLLNKTESSKADVDAAQTQVGEMRTELEQATSEFQTRERMLSTDKQHLQEQNDDLSVEKSNLQRANDKLELDSQQLRDDVTKINTKLDSLAGELQNSAQRNRELQEQNDELRNEAMEAKAAQREAEMAARNAEESQGNLERELEDLQAEMDSMTEQFAANPGGSMAPASSSSSSVTSAPLIESNVVEVDNEYGFVVLDKGSKHSVERGFVFELYRGTQYLGRVRVTEVYDSYSTAAIELRAPGTQIQRFDRATTQLG